MVSPCCERNIRNNAFNGGIDFREREHHFQFSNLRGNLFDPGLGDFLLSPVFILKSLQVGFRCLKTFSALSTASRVVYSDLRSSRSLA